MTAIIAYSNLKKKKHLFKRHVFKTNYCWIWTGTIDKDGYGSFYVTHHNKLAAHRIAYMFHKKKIIEGKVIRHICDNCLCVNPKHLRIGTHKDNVKDRVKKGRSAIGSLSGRAKLNEIEAMEVRVYAQERYLSQRTIADLYGISAKTVRDIKNYVTWRHVI